MARDEHWIDITRLGSPYEEQLDIRRDRFRHRGHRLDGVRRDWQPGPAPDNELANKQHDSDERMD